MFALPMATASDLRSNLDVKSDASAQRGRAQMPHANH
jgi:hypothetical protein